MHISRIIQLTGFKANVNHPRPDLTAQEDIIPSFVLAGLVLALLTFISTRRACRQDPVTLHEWLSLASLGTHPTSLLMKASSGLLVVERDTILWLTLILLSRHETHAEVMCFLREEDSSDMDMLREGSRIFVTEVKQMFQGLGSRASVREAKEGCRVGQRQLD